MKRLMIGAAAAALLLSGPARADGGGYTGNKLFAQCSDTALTLVGAYHNGLCLGYIIGVASALTDTHTICAPDEATFQQFNDIANRYLTAHPELRHDAAQSLVQTVRAGRSLPVQGRAALKRYIAS